MISLHRLDGKEFIINFALIETIEATPDTVITLTNGHKYVVQEPVAAVIREVVRFHRLVAGRPWRVNPPPGGPETGTEKF